jgi:NADPH:quinone reductase-like Zn-dependent oxidoreductase
VGTTTSTANVELVRSFGPDEVVDYQKQEFEEVLRVFDAVLGTVKSDALKESLRILKPGSTIVSLVGPPDATFARKRRMSFAIKFIFGVLSLKITRLSKSRGTTYSFLIGRPDGGQLAEIDALIDAESTRPVIDKVLPLEQAKVMLAYLAQGRAKGKVVRLKNDPGADGPARAAPSLQS